VVFLWAKLPLALGERATSLLVQRSSQETPLKQMAYGGVVRPSTPLRNTPTDEATHSLHGRDHNSAFRNKSNIRQPKRRPVNFEKLRRGITWYRRFLFPV
jgi:hypothetical protein